MKGHVLVLMCFMGTYLAGVDLCHARISGVTYAPVRIFQYMPEEQFERMLVPEIDYVAVQSIVGEVPGAKVLERFSRLAENNKKIILQIWWGPGGRYNWSYHSIVALAYDSEVQKDLFSGIDKMIETIGPGNIYGAHIFEETRYFGIDIDEAGDWNLNKGGVVSGKEDGNPYSNLRSEDCRWSPFAGNLRRFNDVFKKETGLDMARASIWNAEEQFVFRRWCEMTSARAEIAVLEHLKQKYTSIKRFTWSAPGYPNYTRSDFGLLRTHLDGVMNDPYLTANNVYQRINTIRTVCPDAEIMTFLYGGFGSKDEKLRKMAAAYAAGSNALGFFEGHPGGEASVASPEYVKYYSGRGEDKGYENADLWKLNNSLISEFRDLPVFRPDSPILLISGNVDSNWWASPLVYTGLKSYDVVPAGAARLVDFQKYDLVIAHDTTFSDHAYYRKKYRVDGPGIDESEAEQYVKDGGILFISGNTIPPFFLNNYLEFERTENAPVQFVYTPDTCFREKLSLDENYTLFLKQWNVKIKNKEVQQEVGYLTPYGKGLIYYAPFRYGEQKCFSSQYDAYRKFITDILRGLLLYAGKKEAARMALDDRNIGYQYMEIQDKGITVYFQFYIKEMKATELTIPDTDILTGEDNSHFGKDKTAVIVNRQGGCHKEGY